MSFSTTVHHTNLGDGASDSGGGTQPKFTQTSATPGYTVAAPTSAAVSQTVATSQTVTKTNTSPFGFSTGDADKVVTQFAAVQVDLAAIIADNTALRADVAVLRGLVNGLIDVLQARGVVL